MCFQYAITAALNRQNIHHHHHHHPERPFISNYNWKDIEFPSHSKDWRIFEQNNTTCPLKKIYNILKIQISKKIMV